MPGPWALDRGLICRAKMWQVPEGLRAHAARHAPEDGEATEARWVSRIKASAVWRFWVFGTSFCCEADLAGLGLVPAAWTLLGLAATDLGLV